MKCVRFQVSGRVQGVGFRYAAMREAQSLGITGWVKNLSDGDVALLVCGDNQHLDQMEQWLQHGPRFAVVTSVHRRPSSEKAPDNFSIR